MSAECLQISSYALEGTNPPLRLGGAGGSYLPSQTIISTNQWPKVIRQWNCQASLGNDSYLLCAQLGLQQPQNQILWMKFSKVTTAFGYAAVNGN